MAHQLFVLASGMDEVHEGGDAVEWVRDISQVQGVAGHEEDGDWG